MDHNFGLVYTAFGRGMLLTLWCSKILLFTDFEGFFPPLLLSLPSALFIVLSITGFAGLEPDDRY